MNSSGSKGQQVSIPPFESSGGITPEQQALAQFGYGSDLQAQGQLFGGSGTGMSTMDTMGDIGARNQEAMQQAQMSDTNEQAQYNLYQNDVGTEEAQLQQGQQSVNSLFSGGGLSGLASLAGFGGNTSTT